MAEKQADKPKQSRVSQTILPTVGFENALRVAQAIWDQLAGDGGAPIDVAAAMGVQPSGGSWRSICGAAIAYGLTEGGYNANEIKLLPLGRRCVAPEEEGDDQNARVEAFLKPTLIKAFFEKYDGKKFPTKPIGPNVITSLGYPKDRADGAYEMLLEEGKALGIIQSINGNDFVNLRGRRSGGSACGEVEIGSDNYDDDDDERLISASVNGSAGGPEISHPVNDLESTQIARSIHEVRRVFITHGKDQSILSQIEEIVRYGQFEPIISVKTETLAKPVPLKVLDEMRSCQAAVIHVSVEQRVTDGAGNEVDLVNQNVLIEIGAAMALYKQKFVLLVEEGVVLPSNLQGLYECRYSGSELSSTATMKLLKAFNEFKKVDRAD